MDKFPNEIAVQYDLELNSTTWAYIKPYKDGRWTLYEYITVDGCGQPKSQDVTTLEEVQVFWDRLLQAGFRVYNQRVVGDWDWDWAALKAVSEEEEVEHTFTLKITVTVRQSLASSKQFKEIEDQVVDCITEHCYGSNDSFVGVQLIKD